MSDFKAKMQKKFDFRRGFTPYPARELTTFP